MDINDYANEMLDSSEVSLDFSLMAYANIENISNNQVYKYLDTARFFLEKAIETKKIIESGDISSFNSLKYFSILSTFENARSWYMLCTKIISNSSESRVTSSIKVLLVCNAGVSTSILKQRLENEALNRNFSIEIVAVSYNDLERHSSDTDIIALGPQMKNLDKQIISITNNQIPILYIKPRDFGLMNSENILDEIIACFRMSGNM